MNDAADREILHRRALELARRIDEPEAENESHDLFLFTFQNETYAIDSRFARDVFRMKHFTHVPCTPDFIMGLTSLHGEILTVVDIGRLFDRPRMSLTNLNKVVVIHVGSTIFGIAVDEPLGIERRSVAELHDASPDDHGGARFIKGLFKDGTVVLDVDAIVESGRLVVGRARQVKTLEEVYS